MEMMSEQPNLFIWGNRVKAESEALTQCMTKGLQDPILDAVKAVGDKDLEVRLTGVDFVAKEVHYHRSCFKATQYLTKEVCTKTIPLSL